MFAARSVSVRRWFSTGTYQLADALTVLKTKNSDSELQKAAISVWQALHEKKCHQEVLIP